ncbi:MAG: glycosyltransferase [bacterium]
MKHTNKTIVFFTDFYHPSVEGVTASVDLFAKALRKQGHRVYIVAPAHTKPLTTDHPDVIRLPSVPSVFYRGLRDGILTPKYGELIRSLKADIYHGHTNMIVGLGGMRLSVDHNVPSVATYHTDQEQYSKVYRGVWAGILIGSIMGPFVSNKPDTFPKMMSGLKPRKSLDAWNTQMIQNLLKVCFDQYDHVIVPSKKILTILKNYHVSRPISIVPTGLELDDFATVEKPARKKTDKFQLLYVGRLAEEKNIALIIDMMYELQHKKPDQFECTMVGPSLHMDIYRQHAKRLGVDNIITFTGAKSRSEALQSYYSADAFIFPSVTDTQAIVLNEAAYSKLPLLFSDPEISRVAINNKTGLLLKPTPKAYAQAVIKLNQDPGLAHALGQAAHHEALKFTMDRQATLLDRIYDKVIYNHAKK